MPQTVHLKRRLGTIARLLKIHLKDYPETRHCPGRARSEQGTDRRPPLRISGHHGRRAARAAAHGKQTLSRLGAV
jgi:hypothetical protein